MANQYPVNLSVHEAMEEIKATKGVIEYAVVSRDGTLMGKSLRADVPAPAFAAISATMLASAEAASNLLSLPEPSHLMAFSQDTVLLVLGAGNRMLVSATVDKKMDISPVFERLKAIASRFGGEVVL